MLIVFAGLPASGKTTLARELARALGAVHVRIDSIEQALRDSGRIAGSVDDAGYRAGYALAADNLCIGRIVVADSVNPWMLTRDAWREVGLRAGVCVVEVEVSCSDLVEHRARVEGRVTDVPGLALPDWSAVLQRDYRPWTREHLCIDTSRKSVPECVAELRAAVEAATLHDQGLRYP